MFRAFRTRVWGVTTALLAGVLAPWGGQATAQPPLAGAPAGSLSQSAAPGNGRAAAQSKLLQARVHLGGGDFDLADSLARDVESMRLSYAAGEDSPAKLREEIKKARTEPRALLQASRAALARKDFDLADRYATEADQRAGVFTFPAWGDTPTKALADIRAARKSSAPGKAVPSGTANGRETNAPRPAVVQTSHTTPVKDSKREEAKAKLSQARAQLAKGDHDQAEKLAREAAALSMTYASGEDSPNKVLQDVQKAKNDPRTLLQASRAALARRDYDQAERLAKQADDNAGLMTFAGFSDSPSKVLRDIQSARQVAQPALARKDFKAPVVKKDEKAVAAGPSAPAKDAKLDEARAKLAQARKQLARGDHGQAEKLAHEAAALCRTYPASDDNPAKVLQDVSKAKNDPQALLQASRAALARKDYDQAERLAKQADDNAGLMTFAGFGDSPSRALKDIQSARRAAAPALKKDDKTLVKEAKAPGLPAAAKAVAKDPKREEAKAKLSQARMQLAKGDHGQAEKLAREVASMSLSYTADQDSPAKVLQDVQKVRNDPRTLLQSSRAALARKDYDQAEKLAKQADDNAGLMTFAGFGDSPSKALKDIQSARKAAQPAATVKKDEKTIAPVVKKDEKAVAAGPSAPAKDAKLDEARAKLAQARKQLARGDHGQAEKLAHEAAALCRTYPASDDNPAKVLQDVSKAKNDPQALLQASRAALARKDYDQAERLAKQADDNAGLMTFAGFGDSPSRALKDIQSARRAAAPALKKDDKALVKNDGKTAPTTKAPANKIEPKMPVVKSDPRADAARATVKQGRAAFQAGKLDEAKKFSAQARDLKTNLGWWEDNPDRLDSDIRRAEGTQPRTDLAKASAPKVPGTSDLPRNKEAARTLLNRGRDELKAGKFEQAFATAQSVKAARDLSWGLFEDSPDRLLLDVEKARAKRDRDEADRLMADGRKLYEKGDYEGAARLAYRAQRLAGSYSIWDLGDRPSKLLADVQVAQARSRKTDLPPSALARKDEKKADTGVKTPPKPVTPPEGTRPENAIVKNTPPAAKAAPVTPPAKLQAQQLVAESQRLLRDGKLVEARQKAVEAQRLNVTFAADEITPDLVYQQIATEVRSRLDGLVREARGELDLKGDSAARFRNAEAKLTEAKQLAASFGQDTRPIDDRMAELRRLRDDSAKPAVPAATGLALTGGQTPIPAAPVQAQPSHGQQLLEKARLELRRGETKLARRMCEEVLTGNHGVRDEAVALLRTIDAEEFNQTRLAADRTFDAAASAYRRGEHAQAGTLISAIDTRLLSPDRQVRLREMALTPEMKAAPVGLARATDMKKPGAAVPPALAKDKPRTGDSMPGGTKLVAGGEVGKAVATDKGGDELDKLKARQKVLMDKLRSDALDAQKIAAEKARAGQHEAAVDVLQDYLAMLNEQQLEPGQLTLLKRPVEARVNQYRLLKSQRDLVEGNRTRVKNGMAEVQAGQRAEELKKKNVEKIMKDFNTLYKEGKYLEAESMALRAQELDPDNGLATAAVHMARRHRDVLNAKNLKEEKQKYFLNAMNDAERPGPAGVIDSGIAFDPAISERTRKRLPLEKIEARGRKGEAEKNIERRLSSPVRISFENAPLKRVLEDLSDYHGINIVPDLPAMQEAGVSLESPVSIKLDQVSLKSALNLILHQVKLTHVIKDEVLNITTEEHAKGKLMTVTYPVADLVLPVENFGDVRNSQLNLPGRDQPQPPALTPTPVTGTNSMIGGSSVGTPSGLPGTGAGTANGGTTVTKSAPVNTMQTQLIELITKTIRHQSWSDMGGPGTIDYHPLTMALVINQTPDIQEQIQDLLASLRRLQDQEVAVEVRFITVSEDFFERIGVNFNVNILTDSSNRKFEPSLLQNSFVTDPTNFINAFSPGRFLAGSTPAGTLTSTLDIPITNSSFFQTVPAFGNYVPGGGLALGLAFLSDIQVFLFLEAVQGDVRTNLMQAPKLTLFNGQTSTVGVGASQPMITGVQVAQLQGGQFAFIPQVAGVAVGGNVNLTVQAVISADRRFVRLSLTPTFTSLRPGPIAAIPVTFPIFTSIEGNQAGQPVVFTQYISSPVSTFVTISTTVAVPDGGTVLLGGLKQLSEERSEYGPPILSKIPYINRLFKNVGYGRSADSLLIMVTPRIIIQSEEEERATGFTLTPAIQQ